MKERTTPRTEQKCCTPFPNIEFKSPACTHKIEMRWSCGDRGGGEEGWGGEQGGYWREENNGKKPLPFFSFIPLSVSSRQGDIKHPSIYIAPANYCLQFLLICLFPFCLSTKHRLLTLSICLFFVCKQNKQVFSSNFALHRASIWCRLFQCAWRGPIITRHCTSQE